MGSSSSKEESQGVKAVVSESSSLTTGGFYLIEIVGIFFLLGLFVIIIHVAAKLMDVIIYYEV